MARSTFKTVCLAAALALTTACGLVLRAQAAAGKSMNTTEALRLLKEGAKWDATALVDEPPKPRAVALAAMPASYHPALALALSPDATKLAVGCGNQVVLCDVASTNLAVIARATAHPDAVQSLAW